MFSKAQNLITLAGLTVAASFGIWAIFQAQFYDVLTPQIIEPRDKAVASGEHMPKPKYVRGIYLTASSAGSNKYRQALLTQLKKSRINTVVIDIKDYSGYILYDSKLKFLQKDKAIKNQIKDVRKVIDEFHQAGIYLIARQTVFQDPVLAQNKPELAFHDKDGNVWHDRKGLAWIDPSKEEVWQYNLAIAKEAVALGFDEINFDYMRYPSDGDMASLEYNLSEGQKKTDMMNKFYEFLSDNMRDTASTSIDMFGLVMDNTKTGYDLGIGQSVVAAADDFDFVCPMMYASHYNLHYMGFDNVAEHPGEVLTHGLAISYADLQNKKAKVRPWLQAFSLGAVYDEVLIEQQIEAVEKATSTEGWLLWNARNYYPDYVF